MGVFKITGPGQYRQANGKIAIVEKAITDDPPMAWAGTDCDGDPCTWQEDGSHFYSGGPSSYNLIARIAEPQTEMAGLIGFISVFGTPDDRSEHLGELFGLTASEAFSERCTNPDLQVHTVIDLSKVPASAIVKPPEPKRETRKVWIVFWKAGGCSIRTYRSDAETEPALAIVERDIEFVHGEGLGDAS